MYTLRIMTSDKQVTNHSLGGSYTVSYPSSSIFKKEVSLMDGSEVGKIKCFLHAENGVCFIIAEGSEYFVMTENGKTFERL